MNTMYCPISLLPLAAGQQYHPKALTKFSKKILGLTPIPISNEALRREAQIRATKMSIQGVQPKLSARFNTQASSFDIVDIGGKYILKPQTELYPHLPENEALSMTLAERVGIPVPFHGLIYAEDNAFVYFVKRFDRHGHSKKYAVEDFSQLSGSGRDNKYQSSIEKVIKVIEQHCTFPALEKQAFFKRCLVDFILGNEDMHLKNFSLIQKGPKVTLSPAYDLVNTTIALAKAKEEIALPLNGKKRELTRKDWFSYLALERLTLQTSYIEHVRTELENILPIWRSDIAHSMMPDSDKEKYLSVVLERYQRLGLNTSANADPLVFT